MNPLTGICILLTVVFCVVSVALVFCKQRRKESNLYYPTNGKGCTDNGPVHQKRILWEKTCFVLAILFLFCTIISSGKVTKHAISPGSESPNIEAAASETPSVTPVSTPTFDYNSATKRLYPVGNPFH